MRKKTITVLAILYVGVVNTIHRIDRIGFTVLLHWPPTLYSSFPFAFNQRKGVTRSSHRAHKALPAFPSLFGMQIRAVLTRGFLSLLHCNTVIQTEISMHYIFSCLPKVKVRCRWKGLSWSNSSVCMGATWFLLLQLRLQYLNRTVGNERHLFFTCYK